MEVWTIINKNTKNIIHFNVLYTSDPEFGIEYFFSEFEYYPKWFVDTEELAKNALQEWVHPQYRLFYTSPSTDNININDYEIIRFEPNK